MIIPSHKYSDHKGKMKSLKEAPNEISKKQLLRKKRNFDKENEKNPGVDVEETVEKKEFSTKTTMKFDFDSSILDKFSTDKKSMGKTNDANFTNSWNYSKIIASEKVTTDINNKKTGKTDTQKNKESLSEKTTTVEESDSESEGDNQLNEDKFENELFDKNFSFTDLGLSKLLLKACSDLSFYYPTKVQAKVIPLILEKNDVLVNAETGSGKTACYLLPIIQRILISRRTKTPIKTLLIIPTRELALQCSQMLENLIKYIDVISYVSVIGGMDIQTQISKLQAKPDIIIATTGRLIDMIYNYKSIELDFINVLILDEADKLLELGFKDAILEILFKMGRMKKNVQIDKSDIKKHSKNYKGKKEGDESEDEEKTKDKKKVDYEKNVTKTLQTLLFSATLNPKVIDLGNTVLQNPIKLKLAHSNVLTNLRQSIVRMRFKKDDENENDFNKLHESGDENEENEVDEDDNKEDDENKTTHKTMKKELHAQKIANKKTSKKKNINLSKAINSESYTKTSLSTSTEFLQRMSYLVALVSSKKRNRSIIFFNTKSDCHKAKVILDYFKILSAEMHSDVRQTERIEALENFQNGKTHYLLATDVAGRGIDVDRVKTVINFQMPLQKERYTHRIGRTARRGNMGHAITICNDTDRQMFKKLLRDTQFDLHPLKIENDIVKSNLRELKENKYNFLEELQNDAAEKDLDRAEMKIEKNNRQSDFKDDIYNRPKKSWYLNPNQKKEYKEKQRGDFYNNIDIS